MKFIKKSNKPVKLNWTPSPQLIQGVMNTFNVPKEKAIKNLNNMAEVSTRMGVNLGQIPDHQLLQMMMTIQGGIARQKQSTINNSRK